MESRCYGCYAMGRARVFACFEAAGNGYLESQLTNRKGTNDRLSKRLGTPAFPVNLPAPLSRDAP